jgi:hypothetical protein
MEDACFLGLLDEPEGLPKVFADAFSQASAFHYEVCADPFQARGKSFPQFLQNG